MLGKASKSENLLKNRSAVGCCGFLRGMGVARMLRVVMVRGMLRIVDIADGKRQNIFSILGILFYFRSRASRIRSLG